MPSRPSRRPRTSSRTDRPPDRSGSTDGWPPRRTRGPSPSLRQGAACAAAHPIGLTPPVLHHPARGPVIHEVTIMTPTLNTSAADVPGPDTPSSGPCSGVDLALRGTGSLSPVNSFAWSTPVNLIFRCRVGGHPRPVARADGDRRARPRVGQTRRGPRRRLGDPGRTGVPRSRQARLRSPGHAGQCAPRNRPARP